MGQRHTALHARLVDLARNVRGMRALAVDATRVGAGLASFLTDALGTGPRAVTVEPFLCTPKSKSDPGWDFLGLIDGGRFKEHAPDATEDEDEVKRAYWDQLAACRYEVLPGPNRILRWSVPASRGHDDLLISAALAARLDAINWRPRTARGSRG
ncbi:MAG: hypothetical protein M3Q10_05770 [Chloroflexota bacterium]|nr:hypothetical protein [Chloroflexota bacterium]